MKRIALTLALLVAPLVAQADSLVVQTCGTLPLAYAPGTTRYDTVDVNGNKCTASSGSGTTADQVQGNVASGTADSGNPVKVGGRFNSTLPSFSDGQRADFQTDSRGSLRVSSVGASQSPSDAVSNTNLAVGIGFNTSQGGSLMQYVVPYMFNGTTWDRIRGSATAGLQVSPNAYPFGATPLTASATGTTGATTATLAGAASKTTYICGFTITADATAALAGAATVTGTISGTLNYIQNVGTATVAASLPQTFNPCIPASAVNTAIAVNSVAAGTGGNTAVTAWGYQQ